MKKLSDNIKRALVDEQIAQYITKLETEIGTSVNQSAFAQITGANN
jgi:peptidyl-prolyl cis-trans isomerase D